MTEFNAENKENLIHSEPQEYVFNVRTSMTRGRWMQSNRMDIVVIRRCEAKIWTLLYFWSSYIAELFRSISCMEIAVVRASCWYECERLLFMSPFTVCKYHSLVGTCRTSSYCSGPVLAKEPHRKVYRPGIKSFLRFWRRGISIGKTVESLSSALSCILPGLKLPFKNTVAVCMNKFISCPKPDWKSCIWTRWELTMSLLMMNYTFRWFI